MSHQLNLKFLESFKQDTVIASSTADKKRMILRVEVSPDGISTTIKVQKYDDVEGTTRVTTDLQKAIEWYNSL